MATRRNMEHGQDRINVGDVVFPATVGEERGHARNWREIVGAGTVLAIYQISEGVVCDVRWHRQEPDGYGQGFGSCALPLSQVER